MVTIAQQRLEDHKDNPMVQGLLAFVRDTLQRLPEDITNWSIEMSESDYRSFLLQFGLWGCQGSIAQGTDNIWRVHRFQIIFCEEHVGLDSHVVKRNNVH